MVIIVELEKCTFIPVERNGDLLVPVGVSYSFTANTDRSVL